MLIGEYTHTIDDKNRLSFPAKFRKEMGKKVILTTGLDKCLFVFTVKEWEKISGKLAESSLSSMLTADTRGFSRFLLGGAVEAEVDAIGRILVPDFLRNHAGLSIQNNVATKAVIVGVQSRVEIWNEKSWIEYKSSIEQQADMLAEKLGQAGKL